MSQDGDEPADEGDHEVVEAPVEPDETPAERGFGLDPEVVVPLIAGASAIVATLGEHQPTGTPIADFVLTAGFGGGLAWLARSAGSQLVFTAAALALFFSGLQAPAVLYAAVALLIVAAARGTGLDAPSRSVVHAVAGALVAQAALALPDVRWVVTASLMAFIASLPIVIGWWRAASGPLRRTARRVALGASVFVGIAALLTLFAALSARAGVEQAIDDAEAGIDALQDAEQAVAADLLTSASRGFGTAADRLGGPLTWPARWVPVLAQHARALSVAAAEGQNLTAAAVKAVTTADVEQIRGNNGAIDLDLVRDVDLELSNANRTLRAAQASIREVRTPWLLPLLDERLADVEVELVDVLDDIDLANQATSVLPNMLGGEQARTYMVLFVQPAEAREYGGFVGAYGLLRADAGRLTLLESGSFDNGRWEGEAEFTDVSAIPEHYFNKLPHLFPQNLTAIPDLGTIAVAVADLAPQWREDPDFTIDGVMTIDPYALAGLLELTGPIEVPGRSEPISAVNVADYLLRDQYLESTGVPVDERRDGLRDLAGLAFAELLSIEVPGPERLGAIFGPLARENRLAFATFDDGENAFLRRVLLDADLPIVGNGVSMLGFFQGSAVAGKLDAYGERHMSISIAIDPVTLETTTDVTMLLRNGVPADAPDYVRGLNSVDFEGDTWDIGENHAVINIYSRDEIGEITTPDGPLNPGGDPLPTLSYNHQQVSLMVPEQGERTLQIPIAGSAAPGRYDVLLAAQPAAAIPTYELEIRVPDGWTLRDANGTATGTTYRTDGALTHHLPISVTFTPDDS